MSDALVPTITHKDYIKSEIVKRLDENVALEVERRLYERMIILGKASSEFEKLVTGCKGKMNANKQVIDIYTTWLEEEKWPFDSVLDLK